MNIVSRSRKFFLDLLFPAQCLDCGREGTFACASCIARLRTFPPACFVCGATVPPGKKHPPGRTCSSCRRKTAIDLFFSPCLYRNKFLRAVLHRFKYQRLAALDETCADIIVNAMHRYGLVLPDRAIIIPVPLHPIRRRRRGFNQAERIARHLAARLNRPLQTACLQRNKYTAPQTKLSAEDRKKNLSHAFFCPCPAALASTTVVLMDDVKTTGATLEDAARALKAGGASRVWAITVAH